ncbi:MAG: hypothetical protein Q9170_005593 [Blastenia crenularia]
MRSLLVTLVFALSVSARCVKRVQNKQSAQSGSGVLGNGTFSGGQGLGGSSSSAAATTTPTPTGTTAAPSGTSSSSSGSSSAPASGSGGTSTLSTSTGAGSGNCGSMKGICFNGGMQASMYDKITTASDWITFQLDIPGGGATSRTTQDHVPMMAFASNVADAVNMVNGPNPPSWLLTFNEPDYSYMGWTPKMSPQEAADAIKPLLEKPGTSTKFVAPATADPMSDWHEQFYAACGCKDFFSAYNIHQYNKDSQAVIDQVTGFHNKFSDKPVWITEVAPGNAQCSLSPDQVGQFMKDIYKFAKDSGFVDRVFWNSGNQLSNKDENVCNSWLIGTDGNPGPLLKMYEDIDCT